jgi:branched-chain amino acid transport system substrate-binding protein
LIQAGVYSAAARYPKAVYASAQAEKVRGRLRERPFEDVFARNARLPLPNGRLVPAMLTGIMPAADACRPIDRSKRRSMF